MSRKTSLRTDAEAAAKRTEDAAIKAEHAAADEVQTFIRQVEWRVLVAIAALIAHEATIFAWKRMTGQPPPMRRGRGHSL